MEGYSGSLIALAVEARAVQCLPILTRAMQKCDHSSLHIHALLTPSYLYMTVSLLHLRVARMDRVVCRTLHCSHQLEENSSRLASSYSGCLVFSNALPTPRLNLIDQAYKEFLTRLVNENTFQSYTMA